MFYLWQQAASNKSLRRDLLGFPGVQGLGEIDDKQINGTIEV